MRTFKSATSSASPSASAGERLHRACPRLLSRTAVAMSRRICSVRFLEHHVFEPPLHLRPTRAATAGSTLGQIPIDRLVQDGDEQERPLLRPVGRLRELLKDEQVALGGVVCVVLEALPNSSTMSSSPSDVAPRRSISPEYSFGRPCSYSVIDFRPVRLARQPASPSDALSPADDPLSDPILSAKPVAATLATASAFPATDGSRSRVRGTCRQFIECELRVCRPCRPEERLHKQRGRGLSRPVGTNWATNSPKADLPPGNHTGRLATNSSASWSCRNLAGYLNCVRHAENHGAAGVKDVNLGP